MSLIVDKLHCCRLRGYLADMDMLAMLVGKFKELKASQEFDKEALLEAHENSFKEMRQMESMP